MKADELQKIKESHERRIARWKEDGHKVTKYQCNGCKKMIDECQPDKDSVSGKGYWDSATICVECGYINFVQTFPNGKTISIDLDNGKKKTYIKP